MTPPLEILDNAWRQLHAYLLAGGVVMWPLAIVSLTMWLLIAERLLFVRRMYRSDLSFAQAWEFLERNPKDVIPAGSIGLLLHRFQVIRTGRVDLDRRLLDEAVRSCNHSLSANMALIGVLATVAPLLGLLGTVTGMITTFDVLAVFGTGNAKAMAGGISEALITTETGLLVAIPGLYMKGFLDRRLANIAKNITAAGLYLRRRL
jgi:biopolymer transport protein ExbB